MKTEDELIAELLDYDPSQGAEQTSEASSAADPVIDEHDANAATEAPDIREAVAELLIFVGAMIAAEKGIRDRRPVFERLYLAGHGKACFVFDAGSAVLDLPDNVLPELARAAEAVLAYLEGTSP